MHVFHFGSILVVINIHWGPATSSVNIYVRQYTRWEPQCVRRHAYDSHAHMQYVLY